MMSTLAVTFRRKKQGHEGGAGEEGGVRKVLSVCVRVIFQRWKQEKNKKNKAQKGDVTAPAGFGLECLCDAARLRGRHTEKKEKKKKAKGND